MQNILNQIRTFTIVRKELEKTVILDSTAVDKKIEIINKQIEYINNFLEIVKEDATRVNSFY